MEILSYEEIIKQSGLPKKYAKNIARDYDSYKAFIDRYKRGEIEYPFNRDVFCGFRGLTLSEREITQRQKLNYSKLVQEIENKNINYNSGNIIDIDAIDKAINALKDRQQVIIRLYYGLDGEKHTLKVIGEMFNVKKAYIGQIKTRALLYLKSSLFIKNREDLTAQEVLNYKIAEENYLNVEEIFNPEGIVPAIPKRTMGSIDGQDERKKKLLESIRIKQEELEALQKELRELENRQKE